MDHGNDHMYAATKRDVYADITAKIIATIETNPAKPEMPWHRPTAPLVLPLNIQTGNAYQGINIVSLWCASECAGYQSNVWGTYRQWQANDAQVKKGEKSSLVVFYKEYDIQPDPADETDDGKRRVAKASFVFNAAQVEGYVPPPPPIDLGPVEKTERFMALVGATGADIRHGGSQAYYRPSTDHIQMPAEGMFTGTATMDRSESYMGVLLHELTHWSGVSKRLDRQFGKRFGDAAYAMEEMVAELSAAFLCAELGITAEPRPDHAHYIGHWLQILKADNRAIFNAAAKATEAAKYLTAFSAPVTGGDHG